MKSVLRVGVKPADKSMRFASVAVVRQKLANGVTRVSHSTGIPVPPRMVDWLRGERK
jgi:hypothetical protein